MTAFTNQLVHCELFQEFQHTSFMGITKQITGHTIFCIAEQGITEIMGAL